MNVSSIVVQVLPKYIKEVVENLQNCDFCDYHFHDENMGKIIVTIDGADTNEEIEKHKKIQALPHVIAADMMMTYSEDELEAEKALIESGANAVPKMLNDDTLRAEDIVYKGDLRKKMI